MPRFLLKFVVGALGLWVASKWVPGFHIYGLGTLAAAAIILGVVNAIVRPVLIILTLPVTILTLGLFLLVINGVTIELTDLFLKDMSVDTFWHAVLASVVIWLVSMVAEAVLGVNKRVDD